MDGLKELLEDAPHNGGDGMRPRLRSLDECCVNISLILGLWVLPTQQPSVS